MKSLRRECLNCGMLHSLPPTDISERGREHPCVKCDAALMQQGDGSVITVDIAHARESVPEALAKFDAALQHCWNSYASALRLIVGGGLIREAVLAEIYFRRQKGILLDFAEENRGAVIIYIRQRSNP
jgi:hypothetical protein